MADSSSKQESSLRQALAIAIVRNKRRCDQEAAEWRAKCQKLEADLQAQQDKEAQLRTWVRTVLQQQQEDDSPAQQQHMADAAAAQQADQQQPQPSGAVFLPPLAAAASPDWAAHPGGAVGNFDSLMQQVLAAAAAAGEPYSAVADVLEGKAAALSSMLLTNVQVMQHLSTSPTSTTSANSSSSSSSLVQGGASGCVASISTFVTNTLLHAPNSSLSTAYMKQSAACLAAALAPPAPGSATGAVTAEQHQQQEQAEADSPEGLAVQVVQLIQELLEARAAAGQALQPPGANSPTAAAAAAATRMLQQMSVLPSTSLLLCLATAQRLQQCVQELQQANASVVCVGLANLHSSMQTGQLALLTASHCFQTSHELVADLVRA